MIITIPLSGNAAAADVGIYTGVQFPVTRTATLPHSNPQLILETGKTIFATGPNGVGKSSFLAEIDRAIGQNSAHAEIFFGNRHIQFQSSDIDHVGQSLEAFQRQLQEHVTRYHHPWGELHLKSVVRRIGDLQAQAVHDIVQAQESGVKFEDAKAAHPQVLRAINSIFETARLPVRIVVTGGVLRATRGSTEYGIERLSDGERAALLLVGAVLIQPPDSFILIDEPERHLNPAISGALLAALTRGRGDLGFVFASHDLELLEWLRPTQVIHLHDSSVISVNPERRQYDMTQLPERDDIPEELRSAILGSRRRLLLVEGEASSEDKALYGQIYPEWSVVARGGWETVVNDVKALHGNRNYHWFHVAGIIDRDGRDAVERKALADDRIYCLPVPMIENLFLHQVALEQMASSLHQLKGGPTGTQRIANLKAEIPRLMQESKDDVIIKQLVWEANRRNSAQKVSARSIKDGQNEIPAIDLTTLRARLSAEFDAAASSADPFMVLWEIPVKNSSLPSRIAELLGFDSFKDYKTSVLKQIEINSHAGKTILGSLRGIMPVLPSLI